MWLLIVEGTFFLKSCTCTSLSKSIKKVIYFVIPSICNTFAKNFIQHLTTMRKLAYFMMLVIGAVTIISCNDDETYADQKERERNAIAKFVSDSAIHVISEEEFANKGYTTDVSKNEFVLFESKGVYMQIVRNGCGEKIKDGETATIEQADALAKKITDIVN